MDKQGCGQTGRVVDRQTGTQRNHRGAWMDRRTERHTEGQVGHSAGQMDEVHRWTDWHPDRWMDR